MYVVNDNRHQNVTAGKESMSRTEWHILSEAIMSTKMGQSSERSKHRQLRTFQEQLSWWPCVTVKIWFLGT